MKTKVRWTAMAAALLLMFSGVAAVNAGGKWLITPEEAAKVRPKTEKSNACGRLSTSSLPLNPARAGSRQICKQ